MAVKGRLQDMALIDILQILHAERRTAGIHLGSERGYGEVYMKDGEIVHALYRDLVGGEALCYLLAWTEGDFDVEDDESPPGQSVAEDFDRLLGEGFKRLEEARARGLESRGYGEDRESVMLINKLLEMGILEKAGESR